MAGLVHHGSIDLLAAAFAAGVPQVMVPLHFDQPDNAARLSALGAGAVIRSSAYLSAKVARTLHEVLSSTAILAACRSLAVQMRSADPTTAACTLLEETADRMIDAGQDAKVS